MRNSIIYIFVLCLLGLVCSCVEREFFEPAPKVEKDTPVVFTAAPKGFVKTNVGTRAGDEEDVEDGTFKVSRFENKIYNAYFMLFDNSGLLRIKEKATIDEEGAVSYNIGRDVLSIFDSFRICFVANISDSVYGDFVVNTTTWADMQAYYFDVTYAPISETGCPGVPQKTDLNDDGIYEYAMPMFGSKEVNAPYNQELDYYAFQLERLFARVETHVSLGIQRGTLNLTSQPQFTLTDCEIKNIPLSVPLLAQSGPTKCSDTSKGQVTSNPLPSYNLTTGLNRVLYTSSESSPDYRSFYFYMPEHKLGNCGSNSSQSNKPDLVKNTNKRPTHLTFGGYLVGGDGASYTAEYNIYFGENATNSFDLSRNKLYKNYVRINGVNSADHRVTIDKDEEIKDVTRNGQTANCYIIGEEGTYMLPAYKGAYTDMSKAEMCEVGEDVVLACDNNNITITIDHDRSKQSTIVFSVDNSSDLLAGNAVIGRVNALGDVIWSWHLWFIPETSFGSSTDDLGNPNRIGGLGSEKMYDKTTMADRNIGVNASLYDIKTWLPSTIVGTYYKYGHHNPYVVDVKYNNGSAYHGLKADNYEPWNSSTKSKTDPCPPGYRVPPKSVWEGSNHSNSTMQYYSGILGIQVEAFSYWDDGSTLDVTDDIYYPYGYMTPSGVHNKRSISQPFNLGSNITEKGTESTLREWEEGPWYNIKFYRERGYTETIYSDFKYEVPVNYGDGGIHTQSPGSVFLFDAAKIKKSSFKDNCKFKSCTKTTYQIVQKQRNYVIWTDEGDPVRTMTSQETITTEPSMSTDWKGKAADEQCTKYFAFDVAYFYAPVNAGFKEGDADHGYQVRCIVE